MIITAAIAIGLVKSFWDTNKATVASKQGSSINSITTTSSTTIATTTNTATATTSNESKGIVDTNSTVAAAAQSEVLPLATATATTAPAQAKDDDEDVPYVPISDCHSCSNPCEDMDHPHYPSYLKIDTESPLLHSMKPYSRHVLISTGQDDWPASIDEDESSLAPHLQRAIDKGQQKLREENPTIEFARIVLTNSSRVCEHWGGEGFQVLVLPDQIVVNNVTPEMCDDFFEAFLRPPVGHAFDEAAANAAAAAVAVSKKLKEGQKEAAVFETKQHQRQGELEVGKDDGQAFAATTTVSTTTTKTTERDNILHNNNNNNNNNNSLDGNITIQATKTSNTEGNKTIVVTTTTTHTTSNTNSFDSSFSDTSSTTSSVTLAAAAMEPSQHITYEQMDETSCRATVYHHTHNVNDDDGDDGDSQKTTTTSTQFVALQWQPKAAIMICSHRKRDKRCSVTAAILGKEFQRILRSKDIFGDGPGDVEIWKISHIGGHKFAGNVIVHKSEGMAVWYGRVDPCHCQAIVDVTIERGQVIKELYRGSMVGSFNQSKKKIAW
ncbi:Altered inheritance of mitochondria protein 32 [Podila humilis]|nr:Altered inheritance of mitochondria protein 32 [Podila humilis]